MWIYLINIIVLIVSYYFCGSRLSKNKRNAVFCIQASIQWILISGLRSVNVGADTGRYLLMFEETKKIEWSYIYNGILALLKGNGIFKDPGYYLLMKIFQVISNNYTVFLLFVAMLFFIPLGWWVYKNSENPLISYVIFSTLFYSFFAITGIRQTIVTGILVFLGTDFIEKKKYITFYILVFLFYFVHSSAISFIIYPLLYNIKVNERNNVIWLILIGFSWIFKSKLMTFVSGVVGFEQYDKFVDGAGVSTFVYLFVAILVFSLLCFKRTIKNYPKSKVAYNMIFVASILLPLVTINQSAMRGVQYFSIYLLVFIPYLIDCFKRKQQKYVSLIIITVLVFLLVKNNPYYNFYW